MKTQVEFITSRHGGVTVKEVCLTKLTERCDLPIDSESQYQTILPDFCLNNSECIFKICALGFDRTKEKCCGCLIWLWLNWDVCPLKGRGCVFVVHSFILRAWHRYPGHSWHSASVYWINTLIFPEKMSYSSWRLTHVLTRARQLTQVPHKSPLPRAHDDELWCFMKEGLMLMWLRTGVGNTCI